MRNILDFCVELSSRMVVSGANLERVQIALMRITHAYEMKDVCIQLLSNYISLSARTKNGAYIIRQAHIPPADNNLQRLKQLNRLSYRVTAEKPDLKTLFLLLEEASRSAVYPKWVVMIAQLVSMACVCMMFGGGPGEVVCTVFVIAILQQVMNLLSQPGLDQVVVNAITMFTATLFAYLFSTDFGIDLPTVVITAIIMLIPGIPLVNAVRNLLCGNEMNGILQILKVIVETMALSSGIVLALFFCRWDGTLSEAVVNAPEYPGLLIPLSFVVSLCTAITFQMSPKDLWLAGLGGAISRVALILLTTWVQNPLVYTLIAALIVALYAEYLASKRKDPSTYFIYPSILPMIPGGVFYYSVMGIYATDYSMFNTNARICVLTLIGMSIGFVLSSIFAHYIRKMRHYHIVNEL